MIRKLCLEDNESFIRLGSLINSNFEKLNDLSELIKYGVYTINGYFDNDKLVGFLMICSSLDSDDICDIVVDPDYRKKGIASKLLDNYFNTKSDGDIIFLEVNVNNEPAINLYKKYDFEIINTRKGYYDGIDGYVMEKRVKR